MSAGGGAAGSALPKAPSTEDFKARLSKEMETMFSRLRFSDPATLRSTTLANLLFRGLQAKFGADLRDHRSFIEMKVIDLAAASMGRDLEDAKGEGDDSSSSASTSSSSSSPPSAAAVTSDPPAVAASAPSPASAPAPAPQDPAPAPAPACAADAGAGASTNEGTGDGATSETAASTGTGAPAAAAAAAAPAAPAAPAAGPGSGTPSSGWYMALVDLNLDHPQSVTVTVPDSALFADQLGFYVKSERGKPPHVEAFYGRSDKVAFWLSHGIRPGTYLIKVGSVLTYDEKGTKGEEELKRLLQAQRPHDLVFLVEAEDARPAEDMVSCRRMTPGRAFFLASSFVVQCWFVRRSGSIMFAVTGSFVWSMS